MFDPDLSLAELDKMYIHYEYHLRRAAIAKDKQTLNKFLSKVGTLVSMTERTISRVKRGDKWMLYCKTCPFELEPPIAVNIKGCPHCGTGLSVWNMDDGTRAPKRNG